MGKEADLRPNFKKAEDFISKASQWIGAAEKDVDSFQWSKAAMEAKESIEFSVKAIFYLLGENPPKVHEFKESYVNKGKKDKATFEKLGKLLERVENIRNPENEYIFKNFPRPFFLFNFWGRFHNLLKYGENRIFKNNSEKFFKEGEARLAVSHARDCLVISNWLIDYMRRIPGSQEKASEHVE